MDNNLERELDRMEEMLEVEEVSSGHFGKFMGYAALGLFGAAEFVLGVFNRGLFFEQNYESLLFGGVATCYGIYEALRESGKLDLTWEHYKWLSSLKEEDWDLRGIEIDRRTREVVNKLKRL